MPMRPRAPFLAALLAALAAGLLGAPAASPARAAEAGGAQVEARLHRAGYDIVGEARRKGGVLLLTATRESVVWLLVVDRRTGQIVGEKPLPPPSAAD